MQISVLCRIWQKFNNNPDMCDIFRLRPAITGTEHLKPLFDCVPKTIFHITMENTHLVCLLPSMDLFF